MVNIWDNSDNPCGTYGDNDEGHLGEWRVPNLREMLIMSTQANALGFATGYYYMTSTSFSGRKGISSFEDRPGFAYDAIRKMITAQPDGGYPISVRCVRDADPNEVAP